MMRSRRIPRAARAPAAEQEVPREVDPLHLDAGSPRHFHVDQCERDGNAGSPIQHFVEEAVSRVVVVRIVADEVLVLEEELVQGRDADEHIRIDVRRDFERGGRGRADAAPGFAAERIELAHVRRHVQRRIRHARHEQRDVRQIRIGAVRERGELSNELVGQHVVRITHHRRGSYRRQRRCRWPD